MLYLVDNHNEDINKGAKLIGNQSWFVIVQKLGHFALVWYVVKHLNCQSESNLVVIHPLALYTFNSALLFQHFTKLYKFDVLQNFPYKI